MSQRLLSSLLNKKEDEDKSKKNEVRRPPTAINII